MVIRNAHANWTDTLKEGQGTLSFGSFEGDYSLASPEKKLRCAIAKSAD